MAKQIANLDLAFGAFVAGIEERGPSVDEFREALGLASTSSAARWLDELHIEGLIERIPPRKPVSEARAYRLPAKGRALAQSLTQAQRAG